MDLTIVSFFEMFRYLIFVEEIEVFFFIKKTDCLQSELLLDYNSPKLDLLMLFIL